MHVVIFEGIHWRTFAPLSLSRPVFMLGTGTATLLEKQIRHSNPSRLSLWVRPELEEFCRRRIIPKLKIPATVNEPLDDQPALLVSGRTLHIKRFEPPADPFAVVDDDGPHGPVLRMALARSPGLSPADALDRTDRWLSILSLPRLAPQTRLVERLWDLIHWNEESLIEDSTHLRLDTGHWSRPTGPVNPIEIENLWIGQGASLQPGCVLDGSRGPVIIDHHASIGAGAVLQGPCFVGPYTSITPHALIRAGTSIGAMSKVGGEVGNSILFGYSNKAHEGYLGDSYVGKWVNLGAGTITSNLKNTYGQISVHSHDGPINTGRRFLGALIGDHTRTAIGTRLMAGTYLGFSSMIASSAFAPRFVPSYGFLTDAGCESYRFDKATDVMKIVFARRQRSWDAIDQRIVEYVARQAPLIE